MRTPLQSNAPRGATNGKVFMSASPSPLGSSAPTAGELLRQWRAQRGKSQLDLAFDTGISQKHVSFVETGRSMPSRRMVVDLSDALRIPMRERNAIMLAAGYAPLYREEPLDGPAMRQIGRAVTRMLRQHEPFPAIAMDRCWNVIEANEAAPAFFARFINLDDWPKPRNLLRLMFDPEGMQPFLARWEETARSLLFRVQREAVGGILDEKARSLLADLMSLSSTPLKLRSLPTGDDLPMIPLGFKIGEDVLNLFSMITTVGTPQTVTAEEIRLETMFPMDDEAERRYLAFVGKTDETRDNNSKGADRGSRRHTA
jgi:transcriptional regulator with XRE-family HTH domain